MVRPWVRLPNFFGLKKLAVFPISSRRRNCLCPQFLRPEEIDYLPNFFAPKKLHNLCNFAAIARILQFRHPENLSANLISSPRRN